MLESIPYGDWRLGLQSRIAAKRVPINGTIELTRRCNNNCVHCYNNLAAADATAREYELDTEQWLQLIDQMSAAGCLWFLMTGGEILLRPDFWEIYAHAKRNGLLVTLFTNGTLITEDVADLLAGSRPFSIEITLYGHTPETYERVSRTPGSYRRCLRGIRRLLDRQLPLKLKTMVLTTNRAELWDMKRFVEQELGLPFKFDAIINPRCDGSCGPLTERLPPAKVVELDLLDSERIKEWRKFDRYFNHPMNETPDSRRLYRCGGGDKSFAVDPYGQLRMCVLSSASAYDLRSGSFRNGWDQFLAAQRQKPARRTTKCTRCRIHAMCGVCPANAELECRDAESPVDFMCRVAHLRAYTMDIAVTPHGPCEYCPGGENYEVMLAAAAELRRWAGI
jgi:radical SAM protein with 4Fe4S-binding SPASM domain